jgi:phosphoribosylanthranilate isomerase
MGHGRADEVLAAKGRAITTAVKICGLSTVETMDAALDAGADYVGLVFFPKSPRNVDVGLAETLADRARGRSRIVALAVDPGPALLSVIATNIRPDAIQLHGHETPEDIAWIRERLAQWGQADCQIWKAISIAQPEDLIQVDQYLGITDLLVFDAKAPDGAVLPGGNGRSFDWRALEGIKNRMPFMLSGGLTPETVAEAIAITGATAVDVSSGVETAPGVKDARLIQRFLRAVNPSTNVT